MRTDPGVVHPAFGFGRCRSENGSRAITNTVEHDRRAKADLVCHWVVQRQPSTRLRTGLKRSPAASRPYVVRDFEEVGRGLSQSPLAPGDRPWIMRDDFFRVVNR